ncbi:MAG: PhzF family phenazine biosynthesis protein [Deltaproteobacteria bacterium]|nr:PhzF family phenazine biosynthesis protein [Deltaproteobacteria bacterium]
MPNLRYTLCDVFTARPLTGNALAVFSGAAGLAQDTLQAIAREMNLSETVFLLPPAQGGTMKLRIFTPQTELPFAGHPVLGAACVIGRTVQFNPLLLETGAGTISVELDREGADVRGGRMLQPLPKITPWPEPVALLAALGVPQASLPLEIYDLGPRHVMVAVDDPAVVAGLTPDLGRLAALHEGGVAVFARAEGGLVTRVFAPGVGVAEDPATGSAAGPIGAHACRHGWARFGETLTIAQGRELRRPSTLTAEVHGSAERLSRVEVGGEVVVVGRGELRVP